LRSAAEDAFMEEWRLDLMKVTEDDEGSGFKESIFLAALIGIRDKRF